MDASKITRAAVGRLARLGDLYDARKDEFLSMNVFKRPLTEDDIYEVEANSVDIDYIETDKIEEKVKKLDINAEMSLSIFTGQVKLKGSAAYLNDQKSSARSERMTLTYSVRTKCQEVDGIRGKIDTECLEDADATHIVVGIDWGAVCNVTCEYNNSENEEQTKVKGKLLAEIDKLKGIASISGQVCADFKNEGLGKDKKFSYHCKSDVSDLSKDIPATFEAAVEMATGLPKVVNNTNEGKGVPIAYTYMSIKAVRKMCKMSLNTDKIYQQIKEDKAKNIMQNLESTMKTKQKLHDLVKDLEENRSVVPKSKLQQSLELQKHFEIEEAKFKSELSKALIDARSGKESAIEKVQEAFLLAKHSPSNVLKEITEFDHLLGKLELVRKLTSRNVLCLGYQQPLENVLLDHADKKVYILYMDYSLKFKQGDVWHKQVNMFFRLLSASEKEKQFKFIALDCEMQPEAKIKNGMYIEYFSDGILCCEDVFSDEGQNVDYCTIKNDNIDVLAKKPNKRVLLEIRCLLSSGGRCSVEPCQWICRNCKKMVEYGLQTKLFYCKCGGGKYSSALFRCNNARHGLEYVSYDSHLLEAFLGELRMVKETNILILGETGVGKSTWINAMANYLAFPTFRDATESDGIKVLIPSQFTYSDELGKINKISVGSASENECSSVGQSATQATKSYKMNVGRQVIRFIDTPGIADVRGVEMDEKNFENILAHLRFYEEIHGICILLKPNNARLTAVFRFCIVELLAHLHKSAADNIVFCFTNARSTFYRPGDTLPVLQKLLSKYEHASITPHNQFCFDNEAFRFLACIKNKVKFDEHDTETYASSWIRAVKESMRLFEHILNLKPHSIQHTVSLNNARNSILLLSKPLVEIVNVIEINIKSAKRKTEELQASKRTASELKGKLYLDAIDLEFVSLGYPRTVCSEASCVDHVAVSNNTTKVVYQQQCHAHCYLEGVPTESLHNTKLQKCWAMGPDFNCRICGHSWNVHMHMTYDLEKVNKQVVDTNVESLLGKNQDDAVKIKQFIAFLETYITELAQEKQVITDICAQFGCYLKENAIAPFNDEIDSHLEMLIKQERQKPDWQMKTIEGLEKTRQKYAQKKEIIMRAIKLPDDNKCVDYISEPKVVEELKEKLFLLKHNGEKLKETFTKIQKVGSEYNYNEAQVEPFQIRQDSTGGLLYNLTNFAKSVISKVGNLPGYATNSSKKKTKNTTRKWRK